MAVEEVRLWSSPWALEPWLLLSIGITVILYLRGFRKLSRQLPEHFPAWRRDTFLLGLGLLFVALASPLDGLSDLLLQAHMVQHWLLMMVVPPLIWLGSPAVPLLRGLPGKSLKLGLGPLLASPTLRRLLHWITRMPVAWGLWVAITLAWHWPAAYQAALRSSGWHDLEHACFFWASLLLWYPIIQPWPAKQRQDPGIQLVYIGAVMLFNTLFSAVFAFSSESFYDAYAEVPRPWAVSAIADQNNAGAFMWVAGSLPMLVAAIGVVVRWLSPSRLRRAHVDIRAPGKQVGPRRAPRWLYSRPVRKALQWVLALLAGAIVLDGILGPSTPSAENLAGVLPWTYWRGFSVIGLLLLGNLFCAVCPFTLTRRIAARLFRRPFVWPAALSNKWFSACLLVLYLWSYEAFDLWNSPLWTAWIILGYFGSCFLIEGLFQRGSFCRYVCPIGQFNFTSASVSPLEVRNIDPNVCQQCSTKDCLRGNNQNPGCPTGLLLPLKAGNNDCTFCLDCVRACPHDNAALHSVAPGHSIGNDRRIGRIPGMDWASLSAVVVFGAFVNAAAMVGPVAEFESKLAAQLGAGPILTQTLWFLAALGVAPVVSLTLCAVAGRWISGSALSLRQIVLGLAPALIPLGFSMWLAHLGFHLVTAYSSIVPAASRNLLEVFPGSLSGAVATSMGTVGNWVGVELTVLGIGFLVTLGVGWRISRKLTDQTHTAVRLALPWAALALLLYLAGAWIVLQPMEMRGMVM